MRIPVQFGEQGIFKTLQGTEALQQVSAALFVVLCNVFAYGVLCLGMQRQPDPIPGALVCLACAAKLWCALSLQTQPVISPSVHCDSDACSYSLQQYSEMAFWG